MQNTYWGYDASMSTDALVEGIPLADFVAKNYAKPSLVGRYVSTVEGYSTGLSAAEVKDCWARGTAVIPVENRVSGTQMAAGYDAGWAMAQLTINDLFALRDALGLKSINGLAAYLDCEAEFVPDAAGDTFRGWMENCHRAGLVGGIYLASDVLAHCQSYLAARAATAAPSLIWSSEYEPLADLNKVILTFAPFAGYLGARAGDLAVWQYSEGNTIDMDTATEIAMQHALNAPPKVHSGEVRYTCPLRPVPVLQNTQSLATVFGGAKVTYAAGVTPHWQQVIYDAPKRGNITGWIAKSNLLDIT